MSKARLRRLVNTSHLRLTEIIREGEAFPIFCILLSMSIKENKIFLFCKNYLKSLNWIVLLGIALFCIALAIVNNIRVDDAKSVTWIGSQDILEKPADIL